jgi:radical SAM superfamily enzyme YgiQ (UPF0313 family)
MKRRQVLFHQLPPIRPYDPDVAFPILTGFLARHRVPSRTIYWNILMRRAFARMERFRPGLLSHVESTFEARELLFGLSPFLLEWLRREPTPGNQLAAAGIHGYLAALIPDAAVQAPSCLEALVDDVREHLLSIMTAEIERLDLDAVLLWAISSRNGQWVPGHLLTELALARRPDLPVVIGGMASEPEARTMMAVCPSARFAIWGEGELPLLALVRALDTPEPALDAVPRLLYRKGSEVCVSTAVFDEAPDLGGDDYADYFAALARTPAEPPPPAIGISLNTSRGCPWAGCRFCNLHQGRPYRAKTPRAVVDELRDLATRFDVTRVHFADQDFVRRDPDEFRDLLARLAAMRGRDAVRIDFSGDVSPVRLDAGTLESMARAGFDCLLVGFEALTDGLLEKVHKAHRFAHNVHFLKFADKFRLRVVCNILQGMPGETREDVLESAENLHFLRFYPPGLRGQLWITPMRLDAGSPFDTGLAAAERARWNVDDVFSFWTCLPESVRQQADRFHLGSCVRPLAHPDLWQQVASLAESYRRARREYRWMRSDDGFLLHELFEGTVVCEFALDRRQFEVLRAANDRVMNIGELGRGLAAAGTSLGEAGLRDVIRDLRKDYLIYSDEAAETVISIVDTGLAISA